MLKAFLTLLGLLTEILLMSQVYEQREAYLEEYSALAMEEMIRSGVPASITLAQAVLESGAHRGQKAHVG